MTMRAVASFVALQLGWFACVLGAASGHPWLGPAVVVAGLSLHVLQQRAKAREIVVLAAAVAVGFVVDTALLRSGVLRISGGVFSPPWLVALWPNFIATSAERAVLASVVRRPLLASLLGALGGPLAYDAGARLGALELAQSRLGALAIIGLVWGAVVPALFAIRAQVSLRPASRS